MDYATPYSGATAAAPKQKAKATAQKRRAMPAEHATQKGHRRGACRPPAICPTGTAAYGFLKTRFLPHHTGQAVAGSTKEIEGFYRSFSLLCYHYSISPVNTSHLAYPYAREVALHEAARLLREKYPQHIEISSEEDNRAFALEAIERFNTQNTLFYIPVLPLHKLLRVRKRRKAARLLLCIFHYLYHRAGVPFYTKEDSYLFWNYDMLSDWVIDDPDGWDAEDYYNYLSEIRAAQYIGETMMRRLWNTVHRDRFGQWVEHYCPKDRLDMDCYRLANKFYTLWQEYPNSTMYVHADDSCLPDPYEGYDDNDCITMEKYIGFVASTDGWLYNNLEQTINSEFGECSSIQEPVLKRCFDGRTQSPDTLDYECRLFPLINELCYLLNHIDYDT